MQYLFIDFQRASDSVRKDKLWKCMEEFKIPEKLICVKRVCKRQEVLLDAALSSSFENNTGLKQGDSAITNFIQLSITKSDTKYKNGS